MYVRGLSLTKEEISVARAPQILNFKHSFLSNSHKSFQIWQDLDYPVKDYLEDAL